jgi:DNA (cytosine-5)-methyltransferase 1
MGFPDSFKIPVSDNQAYKQFGNSVVVPMMEAVVRYLLPAIETYVHLHRDRKG